MEHEYLDLMMFDFVHIGRYISTFWRNALADTPVMNLCPII